MSDTLKEALKELARVAALAVLPIMIEALQSGTFDAKLIAVTAAVAVLRAVDKYLHLQEKEGIAGGLTRF